MEEQVRVKIDHILPDDCMLRGIVAGTIRDTLQVDISRIGARLAEKVEIGDELKDLVEECN
jgi:hypothetical protein